MAVLTKKNSILGLVCAAAVFQTLASDRAFGSPQLPAIQAPTVPDLPGGGVVAPLDSSATRQISKHVWMIPGFPNIGIIVGSSAVLVVDTGLGTAAGKTVAGEVQHLAAGKKIYLTTTHFHPEHAAGFGGFPKGTVLLRPKVQEAELQLDQGRMNARFAAHNAEALANADYGKPELFDTTRTLDLGGIHARIFWAGPAHTYGDTLTFVEEDRVLISGDVIQNHTTPTFLGGGIGPVQWLRTLKAIAPVNPAIVLPDHSEPGPGAAMIEQEENVMQALITDTALARRAKLDENQAVERVMAKLHAQFPDWTINPLTADGVRRAWRGE